jgi:Putative transposase
MCFDFFFLPSSALPRRRFAGFSCWLKKVVAPRYLPSPKSLRLVNLDYQAANLLNLCIIVHQKHRTSKYKIITHRKFREIAAYLPRHLGAEIGFFSVLHSWNQRLQFHPHIHCVVAAGGLAPDHSRWISAKRSFFLPVGVLSRIFRGKFVAGLRNAFQRGELQFHGELLPLAQPGAFAAWLRVLFRHDWVVYSKRPFGGPEHVLRYLGNYTHRVAISNSRLVALADDNVTFRWRDSARGNKKRLMTLPVEEFLRRFLLHLLPPGFVRIRNFGFLANRNRATLLPLCFRLLGGLEKTTSSAAASSTEPDSVAMEVSSLWRNHARGRPALCRATPASLSTSTEPVRCMNLHPHSRHLLVLRHARRCLASSALERSARSLFRHCLMSHRDASRLHPAIKLADHNYQGDFLTLRTCSALFKVHSLP